MNTTSVLAFAFAIGVIGGLRSMTAPAVVSWAAHSKWLNLQQSSLAFLGSTAAVYILAAAAIVELVVDKLPKTPRRTEPVGLIARALLGGMSGAALCAAANQSVWLGAVLGCLGGVTGGFGGYEMRTRLVKTLRVPDFVVAVLEDGIAIAGGFFIVSRFQ
jgi:uncharacterized membrane protein